jgi:hypothetical protein
MHKLLFKKFIETPSQEGQNLQFIHEETVSIVKIPPEYICVEKNQLSGT